MKKYNFILLAIITLVISSCSKQTGSGTSNGELTGAGGRPKWFEPVPMGMSFIHRGSFNLGQSDQDAAGEIIPTKTVSIDAFWMDQTEITNNEYREFIYWVRDSIARTLLKDGQNPDADLFKLLDEEGNEIGLDWKSKILWDDPEYMTDLEPMYYPERERFKKIRELDVRKLFFSYSWRDLRQAAKRENAYDYANQRYNGTVTNFKTGEVENIDDRSKFFFEEMTNVYPDTLCWIRDYTYSFNDAWTIKYFHHVGFDDYPVVGVTWKQANAFCKWRTKLQEDYFSQIGESEVQEYRLPTEVEWEYASRGGKLNSKYPWGGYYSRDEQGGFHANFKPLRGNYIEDNALGTNKVGQYTPNEYGLYDMSGNVAEWTRTAYDPSAYSIMSDMNPDFTYNASENDPPAMKRKVIRGGSWKDTKDFVQTSSRTFEYQDSSKAFVGFRCVRNTFGDEFK